MELQGWFDLGGGWLPGAPLALHSTARRQLLGPRGKWRAEWWPQASSRPHAWCFKEPNMGQTFVIGLMAPFWAK